MLKRALSLGVAVLMVAACNTGFAEMSEANYHGRMVKLHTQIKDGHHDYVNAKAEARKAALDQMDKLGNSAKDKDARKAILRDCKTKELAMKEAYKTKRTALLEREKKLRATRKESKQRAGAKKDTGKQTNVGYGH